MNNVILFELNEVPWRVIDEYVGIRPRSQLAKLLSKSEAFKTITEDSIQLDPWVSWPTLHRGVTDHEHGILHLGQPTAQQDREIPTIWNLLRSAGVGVGVFGSINSSSIPTKADEFMFYLPDYFSDDAFAHPIALEHFQRFNLAMTRGSARNVSRDVAWREAADFLISAPFLGLRPGTVGSIGKHLVSEMRDPQRRIRRRNLQPMLMIDLFLRQMNRTKPAFATFYTNHVAASMHRYWAALFPQDYDNLDLGDDWVEKYSGEIIAAMDALDIMLGKLVSHVDRHGEATLLIASSLGQGAVPTQQTSSFLTITDINRFMQGIGVTAGTFKVKPAMVPCLSVIVDDDHIDHAERMLKQVSIDGVAMEKSNRISNPLCYDRLDGNMLHIYVSIDNYDGPKTALVGNVMHGFEKLGLGHFAHEDGVNCTAQHVREGSLIIYNPSRHAALLGRPEISTLDVAPSILAHFGLPVPDHMTGNRSISF